MKLASAVTAARGEDVPGQTLGVNSDQDRFVRRDLAAGEGEVMRSVGQDAIEMA